MLNLKKISYRYPGMKDPILHQLDLEIRPGEILALTGGSGAGKSTLLRLITGLENPSDGVVEIDGKTVSEGRVSYMPPERRKMALMFQDLALFPHKTVWENATFPLDKPFPRTEVDALLHSVGLEQLLDRYPHQLSGGQKQRLALVRALSGNPRLLLLDEPFNNLDRRLIEDLCLQFRTLLKSKGTTAILVTHEKDQAFAMADRIAFLEAGRVVQAAEPVEFYRSPATLKAARFGGLVNVADLHQADVTKYFPEVPSGSRWAAIRPEHLVLSPVIQGEPQVTSGNLEVSVETTRFFGREWHLTVRSQALGLWTVWSSDSLPPGPARLSWDHSDVLAFQD